jgi:hypothetical protein
MLRYTRIISIALLVPLLLALVSTTGCGRGGRRGNRGGGGEGGEGGGTTASENTAPSGGGPAKAVEAKGYATLKGRVKFAGSRDFAATNQAMRTQMDAQADKAVCLAPNDDRQTGQKEWIVSKDGYLANVLIQLKPTGSDYFALTAEEAAKKSWPMEVVVDQPHCAFMPRVVVLFPEYKDAKSGAIQGSGQVFKVLNSAPVAHNTAYKGDPLKNPEGSKNLAKAADPAHPTELDVKFKPQRDPITIQCDIHKWMNGKVFVLNHPYAAVTKGDGPKDTEADWGTYAIRDVPAGVKLNLVAWHEAGGTQTQEITLNPGEERVIDLAVTKK